MACHPSRVVYRPTAQPVWHWASCFPNAGGLDRCQRPVSDSTSPSIFSSGCLRNLKQLVYQQCQSLYPPLSKPVTVAKCVAYWNQSHIPGTIQVGLSVALGCLRAAEATLQISDGNKSTFVDGDTSEELPDDACVAGGTLRVGPVVSVDSPHSHS